MALERGPGPQPRFQESHDAQTPDYADRANLVWSEKHGMVAQSEHGDIDTGKALVI